MCAPRYNHITWFIRNNLLFFRILTRLGQGKATNRQPYSSKQFEIHAKQILENSTILSFPLSLFASQLSLLSTAASREISTTRNDFFVQKEERADCSLLLLLPLIALHLLWTPESVERPPSVARYVFWKISSLCRPLANHLPSVAGQLPSIGQISHPFVCNYRINFAFEVNISSGERKKKKTPSKCLWLVSILEMSRVSLQLAKPEVLKLWPTTIHSEPLRK